MAFKATNILPVKAYDRAKSLSINVQRLANNRALAFASGASSSEVASTIDNLMAYRTELFSIKSVPGIADYAKVQEDNPAYDVVAEFNALIAVIDDAISTISTALPRDGSDWLLLVKRDATSGVLTDRSFSGAAMATTITKLEAISAAVT